MKPHYYTLLCSLPHLPHFKKAKQLPLTPVMLEKRLKMLAEEERELCGLILKSLPWHHVSKHDEEAEIAGGFEALMERTGAYPDLQRSFRHLMEQRIVVAWYRSRRFGIGRMQAMGELWGFGSLEPFISELEHAKKARLAHRFPWLDEVGRCLDEELPYELTVMLMELEWKEAQRLAFAHPFGFEEVAAYLIRWTVLQMWFGFDAQKAASRFITLTSEIVSEYRHNHPLFD